LTAQYCQYYNSNCSVNAAGTACLVIKANCSGYAASTDCKWASTDKDCFWSSWISGSCIKLTEVKCNDYAGTSAAICQGLRSSCTWTSGTNCKANCANATGPFDYNSC
jgi:hypothetical protein